MPTSRKYRQFVKHWQETMDPPPQSVGPLTGIYKQVTHRLKTMPIPSLVIISLIFVIVLVVWFGPSIATLVTLLQRGF